jgi:hypothetical protein
MAEILSDFLPLHLGNTDNILVYEDTENNCYVIRDKDTGDLLIKMPKDFPPKS